MYHSFSGTRLLSRLCFSYLFSSPYKNLLSNNNRENDSTLIIAIDCSPCPKCDTNLYIENIFDRYSSSCFLLINLLLPTHKTKGHLSSSEISRNLFTPILKYAAASSNVRFDFSYIGTSYFKTPPPFCIFYIEL